MDPAWPPKDEEAELLARLSVLLEHGGAAHFLDAPVVRADARDFPEKWRPTAAAVERLLGRLFWHAHVDLDVAVDDLRRPALTEKLLQRSDIEWTQTRDGVAHFQIEQIGNDDVAGLLCHEVGRAFRAWLDGAATYRSASGPEGEAEPPSLRDGTIAAIYLGLGVLACNAAQYPRVAGTVRGQMAMTETDVVVTGGLSPREVVYLLAVQAVLRGGGTALVAGDASGGSGGSGGNGGNGGNGGQLLAHATLRRDLGELVAAELVRLAPHRAELAERLGLDLTAPRAPLSREPAPPMVADADRPEPQLRMRSSGQRTFRVARSRLANGTALGMTLGFVGGIAAGTVVGALAPVGILLGGMVLVGGALGGVTGARRKHDLCSDPNCAMRMPADAVTCPGCGATIAGRIAHPNERLEAEERLERLLEAGDGAGGEAEEQPGAGARDPAS